MADNSRNVEGLSPKKRALFELLMQERRNQAARSLKIPRRGQSDPCLLSFAQQRLWFFDQLEPNNPLYNLPLALRLRGDLSIDALRKTLTEIGRRHEILRTTFALRGGQPVQVIAPPEEVRLPLIDLSALDGPGREEKVELLAREETERPFDLARGPLWRTSILKLDACEHVVLFTMHHVVSDVGSMGVLVKEVSALYEACLKGEASPLPELELQYADYACWQRRFLTDAVLEGHLAYWKRQLGGKLPVLDLPVDYPRPPAPSYRGAAKAFLLPKELSQSLKALSKSEEVTLYMTLLAAFKTLLYRYTAQKDIIVGTSASNRNREEIEPLIGFFINLLPMRTDLSGNPRFRELLKRVKEVALEAYAHQDMPFERVVEEIQPERAVRQMPLFNVAFGVQNAPGEGLKLKGIEVSSLVSEQVGARFDLAMWMTEDTEGMQICWIYSKDLFKEGTVIRMHDHFETLLFSVVERPDARLTTLNISTENEAAMRNEEGAGMGDPGIGKPAPVARKVIKLTTEPV